MKIVELALARPALNPGDFFLDLAKNCELLDIKQQDVYGDFALDESCSWLRKFEAEVSSYLGKEDALFVPSGVMSQNIMLSVARNSAPTRATFMCHFTSHLLIHEKEAYSSLLNLTPLIIPQIHENVTQEPVAYNDFTSLIDNAAELPLALILECPHREIGGKCTKWSDLIKISEHCRRLGVKLHMDGARLWEASAAYNDDAAALDPTRTPVQNLCSLFDSIYVSFYKGLGGLTGAMLLGERSFVDESRIWLRRYGGNLYSQLPNAISCWSKFRENKSAFPERTQKLREVVAKITQLYIDNNQHALVRFDPPIPTVSMIHIYLNADVESAIKANDRAAATTGVKVFSRIRPGQFGATKDQCFTEMNMGPTNMEIRMEVWELGWGVFLQELKAVLQEKENA